MIYSTIRIDLDGQKDIQGPSLTSGDVGYGFILEFYKSGKLYDITGYNISVWAKLKGLDSPIPDIGKVANGKGYYTIKPSMYVYSGDTYLEITLTDNTGSHIVTKVLHCPVRSGFSAGQTIGEADYSVLATLINQAQVATTNANNAADYAQTKGDIAVRGATLKIAASNATDKSKAAADYVCDGEGNDDNIEINAAVQELVNIGGRVELSEGTFSLSNSVLLNVNNIWLKGQGRATLIIGTVASDGIDIVAGICAKVSDLVMTNADRGIYSAGTATITNCECNSNNVGIFIEQESSNSIVTNNRCIGNTNVDMVDMGTGTVIANNIITGV